MAEDNAIVYILNGEDEFQLAEFVRGLQKKMGDPSMADMNITRLDGRTTSLDDLVRTTSAMPFLSPKRLVIVSHPTAKLSGSTARQKFLDILNKVPPSTMLVLLEDHALTDERDRRKGKLHWLEEWARSAGERALVRTCLLPQGEAMVAWILSRAKALGGQFNRDAANALADLIGDEPRLADQEIQKLLQYVNYARPIEPDDVAHLTPSARHGDIFAMVDALANRNGRLTQEMYHRLLNDQDALSIFAMVVRQFRLLLLAREILDNHGGETDISRELKIHPFVAGKLSNQARRFSVGTLENIYRRLLVIDEAAKSGQMDGDLALDVLIAGLAG